MLVLFGANGRTGVAVLREATRRGLAVRPIARDDRDIDRIKGMVDVQRLSYADPEHLDAVRAVMEGATAVVSCIDPRHSGPGAIIYPREATANIALAAAEVEAGRLLHVSVMGAFRWSYSEINQLSFELENGIRDVEAPWCILKFSAFFDEVLEGHVRPPDGRAPHPLPSGARWSPLSRRDAARITLDKLAAFTPGRMQCVGGPETYFSRDLDQAIAPFVQKRRGPKTRYLPLPPGDVSVDAGTTRATAGALPQDTLAQALEGQDSDTAEPALRGTVYPQGDPPAHPADIGRGGRVLATASADLRRVVHAQLVADLARVGVDAEGAQLDFTRASAGPRHVRAHGGELPEMTGVRVLSTDGDLRYTGDVDLLRDKLAEEFRCWWAGEGIPVEIWRDLDLGVRRRLARDPHFRDDPLVVGFLAQNPAQR
ncbi:MAG: NAD(P)H-binding protein [Alphaproteobacteria bacterium]|nr:NAD(P)H-binding protein [Alphaproteobacteria bacterium]